MEPRPGVDVEDRNDEAMPARAKRERGGWCRHKRTGKWLFYYRVNGKRVFRHAATEEDAKRGLRKALKDLDKGIATTPAEERLTAKKVFENYRDSLALEGRLSPTERWLFDVATKAFGDYRIPMLEDGRTIRKWTIAERERTTDAWAPSTLNRILAFIKVYFDADLFGRFVVALRALNEDYADAVEFAYLSGNRKGTIAKLRFDQIDRVRKEIRYPSRAANKPDPDVVVLTGELAELTERRFERRVWQPKKGPAIISEFVFHHHGRPIGDIRKTWAKACAAIGITDHRFHDLRHTAITDLVDAGVPEAVAMTMSGHRTNSVFRRYKVRTSASQRAAQEHLAEYRASERRRLAEEAKKVVSLSNQNPTTLNGGRRQKAVSGGPRSHGKSQ